MKAPDEPDLCWKTRLGKACLEDQSAASYPHNGHERLQLDCQLRPLEDQQLVWLGAKQRLVIQAFQKLASSV